MTYYFGSLQLTNSGGLGYFILSRNFDLQKTKPAEYTIARRDGTRRSGGTIDARQISLGLRVIGSSYSDMIARLDTLKQALSQTAQPLSIHPDGRYWQSCDCIDATVQIGSTNVVQCPVNATFRSYDPYSYASSSSSYDTGTVVLTSANSLWNFSAITITGGGNIYAYPLFHIINKTSTGSTTLTTARNSGTNYTTLPVSATSFSASVGDILQLASGGNTQNVTVATAFSIGATTLTVTSFNANATYPIGATVAKVTQWTSLSITQTQDSQTLSVNTSSSVALPNLNNDYIDIQCDPAATNGWSIQTNGSGLYSNPTGVFPVIESGSTTFNISIASASAVSADCLLSWRSRLS